MPNANYNWRKYAQFGYWDDKTHPLQAQYALSKMIGEFASLQTVRGQVVATPSDFNNRYQPIWKKCTVRIILHRHIVRGLSITSGLIYNRQ